MIGLFLNKEGSTLLCKCCYLSEGLLVTIPRSGMVAIWESDGKLLFIGSCPAGFADPEDLVATLECMMYQEIVEVDNIG